MIGPQVSYVKVLVCVMCECVISKDLPKTDLFNARTVRYCKHPGLKESGGGEFVCLLGYPNTPAWCPAKREDGKVKNWEWYLEALKGDVCACGEQKWEKLSFCPGCYHSLPARLKQRLYDVIGAGYEQAYEESVIHLKNNVWKEEKEDV
jgi:hypothetical protein